MNLRAGPCAEQALDLRLPRMRDVPGGNDVGLRVKRPRECRPAGVEVAVMIGNRDLNASAGSNRWSFDIEPRRASIAGACGQVTAGEIAEPPVVQPKRNGAAVFVGLVVGAGRDEVGKDGSCSLSFASPHTPVGRNSANRKFESVAGGAEFDLAICANNKRLDRTTRAAEGAELGEVICCEGRVGRLQHFVVGVAAINHFRSGHQRIHLAHSCGKEV